MSWTWNPFLTQVSRAKKFTVKYLQVMPIKNDCTNIRKKWVDVSESFLPFQKKKSQDDSSELGNCCPDSAMFHAETILFWVWVFPSLINKLTNTSCYLHLVKYAHHSIAQVA